MWRKTITTIVLGIDGATFDLFGDWLDDLPTISNVINQGVGTRMKSVTPPVTSPAWRCYATGKQPSSIGTYWWRQFDREKQEFVGVDQVSLTSKCYWEYLSESDQSVAIMGVPLNIPPREVNGWIVSGGPYADTENYTYPESLQEKLENEFDYQLHPTTDPASADDPENQAIIGELEDLIHQRFDVAEWFLAEKSPDLLNLSLFYINHLQHMAWRSNGVKHLWEVIDERLGQILSDDVNIVIHSDHGLHKIERVFYLNGWLLENGYLTVENSDNSRDLVKPILDRTNNAVERLNIKPQVIKLLPSKIKKEIQTCQNNQIVNSTDFEKRINYEETQAVGLPHGVVYILDESIRDQLKQDLKSVVDPKTGMKICDKVLPAEDVYPTPLPNDSPDLLIRYSDGIEIKDINAGDETTIFGDRVKFRADNHLEGIFLAAGPDIRSETSELDQPHLIDIAPTLLHLHGHPVAEDMDGRVLTEIFAPESEPAKKKIKTTAGSKYAGEEYDRMDTKQTKERLQDLGYLE